MVVVVKQTFTRPSLHDMFWFELPLDNDIIFELKQAEAAVIRDAKVDPQWDYTNLVANKEQLRPDLKNLMEQGELVSPNDTMFGYNPLSLVCELSLVHKSLEDFKQINQRLFNTIGHMIIERLEKTNNTVKEKVYDEDGNFIENGLFNRE